MARPKLDRRVGHAPEVRLFKPAGVPLRDLGEEVLALDELEALRLADLQGLHQREAAEQMAISRATFGRVVARARAKVARALIQGRALRIHARSVVTAAEGEAQGPVRLAVALDEDGEVTRHLGRAACFCVFEVRQGRAVEVERRDNPHRALGRGNEPCTRESRPICAAGRGAGHSHHWLTETFGDCAVVVTRGLGAGAFTGLRAAGIRPVLLEQEASAAEAAGLVAAGKL